MNPGVVEPPSGLPRVIQRPPDYSVTCRCGTEAVKLYDEIGKFVGVECGICGLIGRRPDRYQRRRAKDMHDPFDLRTALKGRDDE